MDDESHNIENLKTYSNNDELLRQLGTILSTPKSRRIYSLLIEKEMYAREIAKVIENKQNPHLPGIKFHLIKMVEAGLVKVETKLQRKNGKHLKYYRAIPFILIAPSQYVEEIKKNKTIHNIFKNIFDNTSTGLGLCLFVLSQVSFFWNHISYLKTQNSLINDILLGPLLDDVYHYNQHNKNVLKISLI